MKEKLLVFISLLTISSVASASAPTSYQACQSQLAYDSTAAHHMMEKMPGYHEAEWNAWNLELFFTIFGNSPVIDHSACDIMNDAPNQCAIDYGWGCATLASDPSGVIFNTPLNNAGGKSLAVILDEAEKAAQNVVSSIMLPQSNYIRCTVPQEKLGQLDQYKCALGLNNPTALNKK